MCEYCLNIVTLDDYKALVAVDLSLGIVGSMTVSVGLIPDLVKGTPCLDLDITTDAGENIARSKEIRYCPICGEKLTGFVSQIKHKR